MKFEKKKKGKKLGFESNERDMIERVYWSFNTHKVCVNQKVSNLSNWKLINCL